MAGPLVHLNELEEGLIIFKLVFDESPLEEEVVESF